MVGGINTMAWPLVPESRRQVGMWRLKRQVGCISRRPSGRGVIHRVCFNTENKGRIWQKPSVKHYQIECISTLIEGEAKCISGHIASSLMLYLKIFIN